MFSTFGVLIKNFDILLTRAIAGVRAFSVRSFNEYLLSTSYDVLDAELDSVHTTVSKAAPLHAGAVTPVTLSVLQRTASCKERCLVLDVLPPAEAELRLLLLRVYIRHLVISEKNFGR